MAESFDTHKAYLELTKSDCFPAQQAEKLVALVNGAIVANVATKSDLDNLEKSLKSEMTALEGTLNLKVEALEKSLKLEMEALEKRVFDRMKTDKKDMKLLFVSSIVIAVGVLKAFDYLLPI